MKNSILNILFSENKTEVEKIIIFYNFYVDDIERLIRFSEKYSLIYKENKKKYKNFWKTIVEKNIDI